MTIDGEFRHEEVRLFRDPVTATTGVIAIHSTVLGPALGGLRLSQRGLSEITGEAMRLARRATVNHAAAGLDLGGGAAFVLGHSDSSGRVARMRAFGEAVEGFGGRYVATNDGDTTAHDMDAVSEATSWVTGRSLSMGGRGDPSPAMARTLYGAIAAAVRVRLGSTNLDGVRVGILGAHGAGEHLARLVAAAGASVLVADTDPGQRHRLAEEIGAHTSHDLGFKRCDVDVLVPCAPETLIERGDAAQLRCTIVAGAAVGDLVEVTSATELEAAGILYVPDALARCGREIQLAAELFGLDNDEVDRRIQDSVARTANILDQAHADGRSPVAVTQDLARRRLALPAEQDEVQSSGASEASATA